MINKYLDMYEADRTEDTVQARTPEDKTRQLMENLGLINEEECPILESIDVPKVNITSTSSFVCITNSLTLRWNLIVYNFYRFWVTSWKLFWGPFISIPKATSGKLKDLFAVTMFNI